MKQRFLAFFAATAFAGVAMAHEGAEGVVEKRMDAMKHMGSQMKAVGQMLKSSEEPDRSLVQEAGGIIEEHATQIPELFPEGTGEPPSEALPEIWDDHDGFTQAATDLEEASGRLVKAASEGAGKAELGAAFGAVGQACSSCHERFREP